MVKYFEILGDKIVFWLLKWVCSWALLFQGLAGVVTFGYYNPRLGIKAAKVLSRWRHRRVNNEQESD